MRYLAIGCVSYCRIFDPDRIVIGGGLVNAGRDLMDPLHEHVRQLDWNMAEPATQIVPASLGSDAGVIGAAGVALAAVAHE
jgi:glucokinase